MSLDGTRTTAPPRRLAALFTCVVVVALGITWIYVGMRSVMDIGGSCAEGGPYVVAQPCPGGTWMIVVSVPLLLIGAMAGSAVAASVGAPNLLVPMWGLLFASLGWNFLDYGAFSGELVWGWIICGVVFELMALPVVLLLVPNSKVGWTPTPSTGDKPEPGLGRWWWPAYAVLGLAGCVLGAWSFNAWS